MKAPPQPSAPAPRRRFSFKKLALILGLIVLAFPVLVIAVVAGAFVFIPLQKPTFVNQDLTLDRQLRIPELLQPRLVNGEKVFDVTAGAGQTQFLSGSPTKTFGYNGSYLGPTIRARTGDKVRLNVTNTLTESTTAHWHGMHVPAAMDGAAHQVVKPAETWQPNWTITNQAAPLWYHPHLMKKTGEQVYRGLGGMFIIDDANSDSLDLPKNYGVDDLPLIVQDRLFDKDNQFVYDGHRQDILGHSGMHGDKILVNGTYAPYANVPAKLVRLRILNASNARRYNFGFTDNRPFHQITTDGGFLEAPATRTRLTLAPAERAEILVDLTGQTQPLTLVSDAVHESNTVLRFVRQLLGANRDENQVFKIIELRPQVTTMTSRPVPSKLNTITPLPVESAATTRRIVFSGGSQIDSKDMDHKRIDHIVRAGDTEIWEISNQSGTYHPMHIHGVQFLILDRSNGGPSQRRPPADHERGWKDTVLIENAETVRVIMRFPEYTDSHTPYMFHCHILEHEDMGMMGQFVVVGKDVQPKDVSVQTKLTENHPEEMHEH